MHRFRRAREERAHIGAGLRRQPCSPPASNRSRHSISPFFNRPADPEGLKYWSEKLDGGLSFFDLAKGFGTTTEAAAHYPLLGGSGSAGDFLNTLFGQLFARWPGSADKDYWAGELLKGKPAWQVLVEALLSARETDQAHIANAVEASLSITVWTAKPGQAYDAATGSWLMHYASLSGTPVGSVDAYYSPQGTTAARPSMILDFEDLSPGNGSPLVNSPYHGLTLSGNLGVVQSNFVTTSFGGNGFAATSGANVGYISSSADISATHSFDLESLYMAAGFNDNMEVRIDGYLGATHTGSQVVNPLFSGPVKINLDDSVFDNVDRVSFTVTQAGTISPNTTFTTSNSMIALDDIEIIGITAI